MMDKHLPVSVWPEWKIVEKIGEGSFGKVYKACRTEQGTTFYSAIKVITIPSNQGELSSVRSESPNEQSVKEYFQGLVDECIQEVSTMEYFRGNSYVVSVEDYKVVEYLDDIGWDIFIRMEYLTSFMEYYAGKNLTEKEVMKLGIDLCKALEYCGQLHIIHRDIKPQNIMISKEGKVKEIADIRDETDLSGLRIAIDLKRGVDPDKLMAKLYRSTTLQDSFSCNFNVLVDGYPRVMGVRQILHEWVKWRIESTRRRINFDLGKKSERLHLLHGLEAILLDIDKAIAIIRGTKLEAEVVPNLMKGFDIDETQAEFVAELKLRNINEEYILNRTKDIAKLEGEIAELEEILSSEENIKKVISDELAAVNKKYVMPRRTGRIEPHEVIEVSLEPEVEEYPVTIMLSRDGYLKKMTDRVLKKATTLKYKDGDKPFIEFPSSNTHELLVFTNKSQVYKCKVAAFEDTKSAQLGSYLPTDLEMEPDESVIWVIDPEDYKADVLFVFENGRVVRVALSGYVTKTNRKRLKNAIYGGSKLLYAQVLKEDRDIALVSSDYRLMNFNTSLLKTKTTTNTQGVQAFTAKKGRSVTTVGTTEEILGAGVSAEKFTAQSLPSAGALMKENDMPSLFD